MRTDVAKVRRFGKKSYYWRGVYLSKTAAEMAAKEIRKGGHKVRIVSQKPKIGGTLYHLYRRLATVGKKK